MSYPGRAFLGSLPRPRELANPYQIIKCWLTGRLPARAAPPADCLDDWLRRDIGLDASGPVDRRTAHYRKMLECAQPLG